MSGHYFYSAAGGFLLGVALPFLRLSAAPVAGFLLLLATILLVLLLLRQDSSVLLVSFIILLLTMTVGVLRSATDIGEPNETVFAEIVDDPVVAEGVVTKLPELSESGQNVTVTLSRVESQAASTTITAESRAAVYAASFPELHYGDRVRLEGRLTKPEAFETDTGRIFNYPRYLAREEVFYEFSRPQVEVLESRAGNPIIGGMARLRESLLAAINRNVPDPHAALTGGVLLGAADALGERLEQAFRATGIVHVVVLSGYHVTIVTVAIGAILAFLGLSFLSATVLSGLGVMLFALLVGMTPTVVRASIMAIIALVARIFSRQYVASRGLAIAAVAMVMVNPHILLFDPSFQLSVLATAGLVAFGDVVYGWLSAVPKRFGIREMATATITAQIAVSPLLAFYMGQLSVVSLLTNLLILPVIPALMASGAATALVGLVTDNFALPFAAGAYTVSEYVFLVISRLAELPFSTISIPSIPIILVFFIYGILILFFLAIKRGILLSSKHEG